MELVRAQGRSGTGRAASFMAACFFAAVFRGQLWGCAADVEIKHDAGRMSWTIGNESIRVVYRLDRRSGAVQLASLQDLEHGQEWAGEASQPLFRFKFAADGAGERTIDSRGSWRLGNWASIAS